MQPDEIRKKKVKTPEQALAALMRLCRQLERKARTAKYSTQYELKTKLIRYGLSLGYDYETVVEAASGLVTDTETCDEF